MKISKACFPSNEHGLYVVNGYDDDDDDDDDDDSNKNDEFNLP